MSPIKWRQLHESFSSISLYQGLDESIMPDGFLSNLKGIVLDMAKSCTFPLPLLAVAFQHLIAGMYLHDLQFLTTIICRWQLLMFWSNLILTLLISNCPFTGSSHGHGNDGDDTLIKVVLMN